MHAVRAWALRIFVSLLVALVTAVTPAFFDYEAHEFVLNTGVALSRLNLEIQLPILFISLPNGLCFSWAVLVILRAERRFLPFLGKALLVIAILAVIEMINPACRAVLRSDMNVIAAVATMISGGFTGALIAFALRRSLVGDMGQNAERKRQAVDIRGKVTR